MKLSCTEAPLGAFSFGTHAMNWIRKGMLQIRLRASWFVYGGCEFESKGEVESAGRPSGSSREPRCERPSIPFHSSPLEKPSPSASCDKTWGSRGFNPYAISQSFGTGG